MSEKHNYDIKIIKNLCTKQPKHAFNCTDVAKKYANKVGIEFSQTVARAIQRIVIREHLHSDFDKPVESDSYKSAKKNKISKKSKTYIVAYAQAHTPILDNLWTGIQVYAAEIGADIIIIPGTYLNHNSDYKKMPDVWDSRVLDYLYASEDSLHPFLRIIPDADILPTAESPLNGLESITGIESSIIGHPRQHSKVVPLMKNSRRKYMTTTGAITVPNYRRARVGKKASANHKMGFVIVECFSSQNFSFRHVEASKDGSFQDLIYKVDGDNISKDGIFKAMIFGDTHLTKEDDNMIRESMRLFHAGNTQCSVWHDLFDGSSINHHQQKDYVEQVIKEKKGLNDLQAELDYNMKFIDMWKHTNMIIIPSNHNDWLDRWVRFNQGVKDVKNAVLFNEFQNILFNELAPKGLYAYLIDQKFGNEVMTLDRDESFMIGGFEINNHGDLGANGAKGSPLTNRKLNTKIVSGDKHTMYTLDNAYGVGVSSALDHKYNKGLTSWNQSNGIILENNTFQHLIYEGNKFTNLI